MPQYANDDVQKLLKVYDTLQQRQATFKNTWQLLASLMRPVRLDVQITQRAAGAMRTQALFDSTGVKSASDLASDIQGSLYPIDSQWFHFQMAYKPLNEMYEVRLWLQECEERTNWFLQQSNFQGESHETTQDLVVFGTGCLLVEEAPSTTGSFGGFLFRAYPVGRYCVMEGPDGRVNQVWVQFKKMLSTAAEEWSDTLPDPLKEKLATHPADMLDVLHIMRPSPGYLGRGRRPYESIYIALEQKRLLSQGYHRMLRFVTPRWSKVADEEYGTGQGHTAYPNVATLNRAVEMRFKQWAKDLDPPVFTRHDGVIGKLRMTPGTRNVARDKDAVWTIPTGTRWDVNQFQEDQIRAAIRNAFFADKLNLPAKQYMTAYEVSELIEIMQRQLGPTIGRIKDEFLRPVLDNAFDLLFYAGALPPPPQAILQAAAFGLGGINVEYESPLTRSSRKGEIVAFERSMATLSPVIAMHPEADDNLDFDEVYRGVTYAAGLPEKYLRDPDEVAKRRQSRAEQQAQQSQQQAQLTQSEVSKNMGMAIKHVAPVMQEDQTQALPAGVPS